MKVVILLFVVAMASKGHACCPKLWLEYQGNCYRYFGDRLTYTNAEARCVQAATDAGSSNGHLASIHSDDENRFVYEMFRSCAGDTPDWVYNAQNHNLLYGVWLGTHQQVDNGAWKNTDGSTQTYFNWLPGEPNNNYYSGLQVEDCVHIWRTSDASDNTRGWNDIYCDENMFFVCKMPATP